jgi:hypothetical protein
MSPPGNRMHQGARRIILRHRPRRTKDHPTLRLHPLTSMTAHTRRIRLHQL